MGTNSLDAGTRFRELLARPNGVYAHGIFDALSATVAQMADIEVVYVGGYAEAARNRLPDMGLRSPSQILEHARTISKAIDIPIIVDIDDGYGGVLNVIQWAEEFLSLTNVAGIHLEDQRYPKRCGHIAGKTTVPIGDFIGKLKATIDVRNKVAPTKVIIARTDAFSAAGGKKNRHVGGDISESIKRALAYIDAGADLVWCEFPSPDLISAKAFARGVRKKHPNFPLAFNISPSFKPGTWESSPLTEQLMNGLGYKFRFTTYLALLAAMHAVYTTAKKATEDGTNALRAVRELVAGTPVEIVNNLVDVDRYHKLEEQYDPKARERIATSEGFKAGERFTY